MIMMDGSSLTGYWPISIHREVDYDEAVREKEEERERKENGRNE